jgi:hypothetical protein
MGWSSQARRGAIQKEGFTHQFFRADAGFANTEVYEFLEAEGIKYAIRLLPTASCRAGLLIC